MGTGRVGLEQGALDSNILGLGGVIVEVTRPTDSASLLPLHGGGTRVKVVCASNCLFNTSTTSKLPSRKDVGFTMLNLFIGLSSGKCLASSWHWRFCNERKQRGTFPVPCI
ncbi:hypothetical protein GQ457_05G031360 [Hibiscus cannabinus]